MASVQKRGENSWLLVVEAGYDSNGKRIKKTKTVKGMGKREAEKELAKFVTEVEAGQYIAPEKMTFTAFVGEWREKYAKSELSAKTLENYLIQINNRLIPEFGHLRLDQIKPLHIVTFLRNLQQDGGRKDGKEGKLSSGMIEYVHRVLKNVFNRAVDWKVIKTSPMEGLKKPKVEQAEMSVYDEEEVQRLFLALEKEKIMWRVMITLALTTGLRRGELLGLEWKHIDLETGTIDVKQSLSFVKEIGYQIKEPKTKNSVRKVAMPPSVIHEVKALKMQSAKERMHSGNLWEGGEHFFVFSSWNGKPLYPSSVKTWWSRFIKRNALRYIRFHDLRHTSATLLINKGVHAKIISERLGHANILTTMNIYGHALRSADQEAAKHFDSLFEPKQQNKKA
ncbi:site-specific integrase [Brevibacillus invocatus]|uniref:site-specific integrase n=1 Tax=Brevibacillus invocatus TaxID=173959 RepID=UPI00203B5A0A|nr:site-specific integrase [Brevibacillus invocatus]MCM3079576.1 site-specific integrase [Brevibacillus invocatus]MCM3429775.1 site-specific integrase [Brevibacillus invocatus]